MFSTKKKLSNQTIPRNLPPTPTKECEKINALLIKFITF